MIRFRLFLFFVALALTACDKPAPLEERVAQGCPDAFDVECQKVVNRANNQRCWEIEPTYVYVRGIMGTGACVKGFRLLW